MSAADVPAGELMSGELTLTGRITTASNATFLGAIGDTPVVYKPVAGEAPLWDFPAGTLARREVAAHRVSEALGWDIVPRTWLRDGPFGEGMVQLWQEQDPEQDAVDLFPADEVPASGWLTILEGEDEGGNRLVLAHEDSAALRRMAVFDVIVNNAGWTHRNRPMLEVSEAEFDEIHARITARGLPYWADPFHREEGRINTNDGGRGLYWDDPDGHRLEILTVPYGGWPA